MKYSESIFPKNKLKIFPYLCKYSIIFVKYSLIFSEYSCLSVILYVPYASSKLNKVSIQGFN